MSPLIHDTERLPLERGKTLFDYADTLRVRVPTSCGRTGECHECIVEVKRGLDALSPLTDAEAFLRDNYRLACQAAVLDPDAEIEFSVLRRQPKILRDGIRRDFDPDPLVVRLGDGVFSLHGPNGLRDPRLPRDPGQLEQLAADAASGVSAASPAAPVPLDSYRGGIYGLAVDVGTTTVVINLVDLEHHKTVYTASFENPQRFGGSDVMHRISYDAGEFHGEMTAVIHSSVNFEIGDMCRRLKIRRRQIYELVVVGNSTMRDLFFGLPVQTIGEKPYRSVTEHEYLEGKRESTALVTAAWELGIRIHPKAVVYGAPLIASHVGADITADLLAISMDEQKEPVILVDVGTNTEIVVGNRERLLAASCPAGPAFEGGQVTYAMPGYDGAIEEISLNSGTISYKTIGDKAPEGICGSGLIDLLAELRRTQKMNELGVFADGSTEFLFEPNRALTISRSDLSALAQAKAANYCGQSIVLSRFGMTPNRYGKLFLAGGFANYINIDNALEIGFLAGIERGRIEKVGNASLEGATIMLLSGRLREEVDKLVRTIEHVELETEPSFFELFVEGCQFKPMELEMQA